MMDTIEFFKAAQQGNLTYFINICDTENSLSWLSKTYQKSGDTALHCACRFGHLELVKFLLECGADSEASNFDGKRCLHETAQHGHLECLQYVLSCRAEVDCLKRADW
jgi:ankyrin repeat protein